MRILHFADVHIGVESYGRPATEADVAALPAHFAPELSPEQRLRTYSGLSTRLLDFLAALDQVVAYAVERRVDLALFCGDAYKSRDPSQTQQREFARRVARLAQAGIPVFLLVGNHDQPHSLGRATALDIFPTLAVPQVVVADRVATHRMETRSGPLQIVAVPWVRRGAFLAAEEHRGKSQEELAQFVQDRLTELVMAEAARLDPSLPAVVAGHVTVMGGVGGSEQSMALGRDHVLTRSALALPGVDYVALGHLHRHQVLGGGAPPVVYAGSLQRVDFGEEVEEKGFCVVEISGRGDPPGRPYGGSGRTVRWEFVAVQARSFVTVDVTLDAEDVSPTQRVLEAIGRKHVRDAVVRVRIAGPEAAVRGVDERAVRQALASAHHVAAIARDVARDQRPRLGMPASSLTPEEALRRYLETRKGSSEAVRARALEAGRQLIQEEQARERG
ncbi:MAG: exonuclease SbcCD subunit D [Dehalococcoidia bacterium]|nr:exonuclease SbcCD subunit D [Dehalococcoidia bacterium]